MQTHMRRVICSCSHVYEVKILWATLRWEHQVNSWNKNPGRKREVQTRGKHAVWVRFDLEASQELGSNEKTKKAEVVGCLYELIWAIIKGTRNFGIETRPFGQLGRSPRSHTEMPLPLRCSPFFGPLSSFPKNFKVITPQDVVGEALN